MSKPIFYVMECVVDVETGTHTNGCFSKVEAEPDRIYWCHTHKQTAASSLQEKCVVAQNAEYMGVEAESCAIRTSWVVAT